MAYASIENNERTVRRVYENCLSGGQMELLDELVAPDYIGPQGDKGPAGFARALAPLRTGFPDLRYRIMDIFGEGDRVAIRWTLTGTHQGPFQGFAATGKRIAGSGIGIFQLQDGKIVRGWTETNRIAFLQQIGALPPEIVVRLQASAPASP